MRKDSRIARHVPRIVTHHDRRPVPVVRRRFPALTPRRRRTRVRTFRRIPCLGGCGRRGNTAPGRPVARQSAASERYPCAIAHQVLVVGTRDICRDRRLRSGRHRSEQSADAALGISAARQRPGFAPTGCTTQQRRRPRYVRAAPRQVARRRLYDIDDERKPRRGRADWRRCVSRLCRLAAAR